MAEKLPICILGPSFKDNQTLSAATALGFAKRPSIDDIKSRLKQIRDSALANNDTLIDDLKKRLDQFKNLHVFSADTAQTAANYIKELADTIDIVSINKSSTVIHELKPELVKLGFTCIDSYFNEFRAFENKVHDYWQLANIKPEELFNSFDITAKLSLVPSNNNGPYKTKNYIAVLGVNAASAEDGTLFFMQHFSNITKDLEQAQKVILIIGLEKILSNNEDAEFLTKCMGIFGIQGILMDLLPTNDKGQFTDNLLSSVNQENREIHVILLDNGRKALLNSPYRDLFLCIGCRACLQKCPVSKALREDDVVWSPVNYLKIFERGDIESIDACLHCEGCRLQCPLDIDIPQLMWKVKMKSLGKQKRELKSLLLDNPELLAKLGATFSPLSNMVVNQSIVRTLIEKIAGVHRESRMPSFHHQTFRKWYKSQYGNKNDS